MTAETIPQFPDDFNLCALLIVDVGRRSARWLAHEIMAVQQAIAAGASTDALCELVRSLVAHRPTH